MSECLARIINGWFDIDPNLLFVIEFKSNKNNKPHLLSVLDLYFCTETMPVDMRIGEYTEAVVCEWIISTLYLYMLNDDLWPYHWPTKDNIVETYYRGKY